MWDLIVLFPEHIILATHDGDKDKYEYEPAEEQLGSSSTTG